MKYTGIIRSMIIVTAILFFCISTPIRGQIQSNYLDDLFISNYKHTKSGGAILVSKRGKIIYQNQTGMASVEHAIPVRSNTKFHIGSITKQFTAAAILMLEEEGKLKIEDRISKYLNDIPENNNPVTIQQLLTHTSGIKDYPQVSKIRKTIRNNYSPREIIDLLRDEPLEFKSGTAMSYSNSGYILLGLIIENVSGQDYGSFLAEKIFDVLEMGDTEVNTFEGIVENRAIGYSEDENDQLINATFHSSPFSAGAIVSTVGDLNKWISGLFGGKLINLGSLQKMLANNKLENGEETNLGFGWEINEIQGIKCFEHSGFVPGYKANSLYFPEEEIYVVAMQNNEYGSPTPVMINTAASIIGNPYPNVADNSTLSSESEQNLVGVYALENGEERFIAQKDKQFFIKAAGGQSNPLYVLNDTTLFYKEGYRQLKFEKDSEGRIEKFKYINRRSSMEAKKVSNSVPEEKEGITLDSKTLAKYIGTYQFEPFKMFITLENDMLFIQPEGSNMLPILPTSDTDFIVEEIGAEIEFLEESGNGMRISLLLEGNIMIGVRE